MVLRVGRAASAACCVLGSGLLPVVDCILQRGLRGVQSSEGDAGVTFRAQEAPGPQDAALEDALRGVYRGLGVSPPPPDVDLVGAFDGLVTAFRNETFTVRVHGLTSLMKEQVQLLENVTETALGKLERDLSGLTGDDAAWIGAITQFLFDQSEIASSAAHSLMYVRKKLEEAMPEHLATRVDGFLERLLDLAGAPVVGTSKTMRRLSRFSLTFAPVSHFCSIVHADLTSMLKQQTHQSYPFVHLAGNISEALPLVEQHFLSKMPDVADKVMAAGIDIVEMLKSIQDPIDRVVTDISNRVGGLINEQYHCATPH